MAGIFQKAILAWRRFPLALLLAVMTAVCLTTDEWVRNHVLDEYRWGPLLASWSVMAFCWTVCGHLWAERLPRLWQRLLVPVLVVAVTALVWGLGYAGDDAPHRWNSSIVVGVVGLLFLLVLPLLTPTEGRDLRTRRWLYGLAKAVVLSFLVALVIFIGLGLQLYLVEVLFSDYLRDYMFPLMILCQAVFAPWCALALAPSLWRAEETVQPPALAVKIVVQYVLGGLLVLYCVTLNIYCLYVLVSWQWPEGAIAGQVVALAAAGGLIWTLVYAVRDDVPGRLERLVLVGFWPGLLAPVVALFIASSLRIEQYGLTEPRYYLLLGGGLTLLGGVLQLARRRIPSPSLLAVPVIVALLLTSFGPWSAEVIAVDSQSRRLETTLSRLGMLGADGKVTAQIPAAISAEDQEALRDVVRFLVQHEEDGRLEAFLPQPELYRKAAAGDNIYGRTRAFMDLLPLSGSVLKKSVRYDLVLLPKEDLIPVRGYDMMFHGVLPERVSFGASFSFQGKTLELKLTDQAQVLIRSDEKTVAAFDLTPGIRAHLEANPDCEKYSGYLSPPLEFDSVLADGTAIHLLVTSLRGIYLPETNGGTWDGVERIDFVLLLKEKP